MSEAAHSHPGPALLAHEARVTYGPVPRVLDGHPVVPGTQRLSGDQFLFHTGSGYGLFYRKGAGVTVERGPQADPAEEALWLNGSVYAAIAAIHGYLPFHASAVVWQDQAYAISGPSGAGKSTLAAALGRHGLPLLCDDTLVLDLSDPGGVLCLPGHKRLKLTREAIDLTGAVAQEQVDPAIEKFYAAPPGGAVTAALPLAGLWFLEDGQDLSFEPIEGAARLERLNDDHYTIDLFNAARAESLADRFARTARLAAIIPMQRLTRPRDPAQFEGITARIAARIKGET